MFRRMYLLLFNRITDAIEAIERGDAVQARTILIRAQQDAEELYIKLAPQALPRLAQIRLGNLSLRLVESAFSTDSKRHFRAN